MSAAPPRSAPLSLLVEILDWLLAPLIVLWPLSVVVTFWVANVIANIPYDRALRESVSALSQQVRFEGNRARATLPSAMASFLRADELDAVRFQIRGPRGEILAGDSEIAEIFPDEDTYQQVVYFRDDVWHDDAVRIAYMFIYGPGETAHRRVLIQVGETLSKRQQLANEIITGIIVPQFFLFPFVALLAWFGLKRGTRPLDNLSVRLRMRQPSDLSPIDLSDVPEEVVPLVDAFNGIIVRLSQSMRSQERFIADAAHQLRTPLAGLRTQLELALRHSDPRDVAAGLEHVRSSVERTAHVVSQLLSLARSQSGAQPRLEPVDLGSIVREVTQEFVPRALDKRIDLGYEGPEKSAWVEGNALLLHELFSNLLDNAIRYTPVEGKVTARLGGRDTFVVDIEDNGIGVGIDDRDLIFERFYRVMGNDSTGSGLGLPIVRSIAEQHRATVRVGANPAGRGSIFSVEFPPSTPRPTAARDDRSRAPASVR